MALLDLQAMETPSPSHHGWGHGSALSLLLC